MRTLRLIPVIKPLYLFPSSSLGMQIWKLQLPVSRSWSFFWFPSWSLETRRTLTFLLFFISGHARHSRCCNSGCCINHHTSKSGSCSRSNEAIAGMTHSYKAVSKSCGDYKLGGLFIAGCLTSRKITNMGFAETQRASFECFSRAMRLLSSASRYWLLPYVFKIFVLAQPSINNKTDGFQIILITAVIA